MPVKGRPLSQDHKDAISRSLINRWQNLPNRYNRKGIPLSYKHKQAISQAMAQRWKITFDTGVTIDVFNMKNFCRYNDYKQSNLSVMAGSSGRTLTRYKDIIKVERVS